MSRLARLIRPRSGLRRFDLPELHELFADDHAWPALRDDDEDEHEHADDDQEDDADELPALDAVGSAFPAFDPRDSWASSASLLAVLPAAPVDDRDLDAPRRLGRRASGPKGRASSPLVRAVARLAIITSRLTRRG